MVGIVKEHMLLNESAHFCGVIITLRKNVSNGEESKSKKLARLMLHSIDKWNVRLGNALDVDLNITWSQNVQSKYILMKKVIVHATTSKRTMIKRYNASMAQMYSNNERSSENYGDSLQLTNWILDSRATCHMKPEVSDFIPG